MRIAVLSDTHLHAADPWFEAFYARHLAPADAVLHCGDITGASVLHYLTQHPNFHAVAGNMDRYGVADSLPGKSELLLDGVHIGLTHGFGFPWPISQHLPAAFSPGTQLICFGHTHVYQDNMVDGVRVLNPGSLTSPRQGPCSMALVHVDQGTIVDVEKVIVE